MKEKSIYYKYSFKWDKYTNTKRKHADKSCIYGQRNFIALIMYSWVESEDGGWTWPKYLTSTQKCVIKYVN